VVPILLAEEVEDVHGERYSQRAPDVPPSARIRIIAILAPGRALSLLVLRERKLEPGRECCKQGKEAR
jgi:hypothetical protein